MSKRLHDFGVVVGLAILVFVILVASMVMWILFIKWAANV